MPSIDPRDWCRAATAAALAGVNRPRLYVLANSGRIRSMRLDGVLLAHRGDAVAWRARSPRANRPPMPTTIGAVVDLANGQQSRRRIRATPQAIQTKSTTSPKTTVRSRRRPLAEAPTTTSSSPAPAEPGAPRRPPKRRPAGGAENA